MKKIMALLIAVILSVSITGCLPFLLSRSTKKSSDEKTTKTDTRIEVKDVLNLSLKEAKDILLQTGLSNIKTNIEGVQDESRLIVIEQSIKPGTKINADDEIILSCKKLYTVSLNVKSETNLLFSKYDIVVSVDDNLIGTIPNGETLIVQQDIIEGNHEIKAVSAEKSGVKEVFPIEIKGDMSFSCLLAHDNSSIKFKNVMIANEAEATEVSMIDVTGMLLKDAETKLKDIGFTDVKGEPYGEIWDKGNWLVTSQEIEAGTILGRTEHIQLNCTHLDDYFKTKYSGETLDVVQKLAEEEHFFLRYTDSKNGKDINTEINSLTEEKKQYWLVDSARNYSSADRTASLALVYLGTPEESSSIEESIRESEEASIEESIRESVEESILESLEESELAKVDESEIETETSSEKATEEDNIENETSQSENALDIDTYLSIIELAIPTTGGNGEEVHHSIERDGTTIKIKIWQDGLAKIVSMFETNKDELKPAWDYLVETFREFSGTIKSGLDLNGLTEYNVALMILNDYNTDNVLAAFLNDKVIYNVIDEYE